MPVALQRRTGSISVGPDGSVAVETLTHIVVTYGDGSQLEAKGQTLKAVLDWSEREGVALAAVDVTVPGAPTARRYGAPVDSSDHAAVVEAPLTVMASHQSRSRA